MTDPKENFAKTAPPYMKQLMNDFNFDLDDSSAIFGNGGYESLGFTKLQEIKPVVKGSKGGWGWFQWTGPRRRAFEAYCKRNKLDLASNEANYKWLFVELKTTEKSAVQKVKNAVGLHAKTKAFENAFERSGVKAYAKRYEWADFAKQAYLDYNWNDDFEDKTTTSLTLWDIILIVINKFKELFK